MEHKQAGTIHSRKRIALITGASSGMGMEFVKQIARKYKKLDEIWVIARRADVFISLQKEISIKLRAVSLDLTSEKSLLEIKTLLNTEKPLIQLLVNSAGFGKIGSFSEIPYEDTIGMIKLNCTALTAITYLCLPYMRKGSHIIELSSAASFLPQPYFTVYAATKAYVQSFSRALHRELADKGIIVTAVCPGPVKTEFFERAETVSKRPDYKKLFMAEPDKVVALALSDTARKKDISVYGMNIKLLQTLAKLLPHRLVLRFMKFK